MTRRTSEPPLTRRTPPSPGVVVEGEPEGVIRKLNDGDGLVQLTVIDHNGCPQSRFWINPTYVRLVAEAT